MSTVLVIAAHPDDEVLGCGGVMARHTDCGDIVHVLIVAEGATSRASGGVGATGAEGVAALRLAAGQAARTLGALTPRFLGFPDNRLDTLSLLEIVQAIEAVVAETGPEIVYTHHGGDLNIDHRIVHQAVLTACRPLPNTKIGAIYAFETASSTEWGGEGTGPRFAPNRYVSISQQLDRKLAALKCYDVEMRAFPHARSYDAVSMQAGWRGASCGLEAAEAFMVLRQIAAD
jgi:N-acetylglucosamine malate deacetylase 1